MAFWKFESTFLYYVALVTCPPLTAPDNGNIDCSVGGDGEANSGDSCTFTCDDGYELKGNTSRKCGNDGSWSGSDAICRKGMALN